MRRPLSSLTRWVVAGVLAVVGTAASSTTIDTVTKGFISVNDRFSTIDVPGATATLPHGINNAGQIVGYSYDGKAQRGFLDNGGTFTTIDVPGADSTFPTDINSTGQ